MTPKRVKKFTHRGRQLEVWGIPLADKWKVRVFENEKPVTGVVYSVAHDTTIDPNWTMKAALVDELMALAEEGIKREIVPLMPPPGEAIP